MGRTDASQKKSHWKLLVWSHLQNTLTKTDRAGFRTEESQLIVCSYLPCANPFCRLGPGGALTDRETKTPQPRCSEPPPASLKGHAATRPGGGLAHCTSRWSLHTETYMKLCNRLTLLQSESHRLKRGASYFSDEIIYDHTGLHLFIYFYCNGKLKGFF